MVKSTIPPRIKYVPLDRAHCALLSPHVCREDRIEAAVANRSIDGSLLYGLGAGPAWAVISDRPSGPYFTDWPHVLGIGGYTHMGAIWSFWRVLARDESRAVMSLTPEWMRAIREHAGAVELSNYVWTGNRPARLWLIGSHCFRISEEEVDIGGFPFLHFSLKSAEELANV